MAPISAFDQFLAEDDNVNRLADTLSLWQKICSNRLLAGVELILFLNKLDILKKKIDAGASFAQYVTSYKKPNDVKSITKCKFQPVFRTITLYLDYQIYSMYLF
jgi:guanine nucleotide-binding protein subunit alpha